jgi:hypothetical protein
VGPRAGKTTLPGPPPPPPPPPTVKGRKVKGGGGGGGGSENHCWSLIWARLDQPLRIVLLLVTNDKRSNPDRT